MKDRYQNQEGGKYRNLVEDRQVGGRYRNRVEDKYPLMDSCQGGGHLSEGKSPLVGTCCSSHGNRSLVTGNHLHMGNPARPEPVGSGDQMGWVLIQTGKVVVVGKRRSRVCDQGRPGRGSSGRVVRGAQRGFWGSKEVVGTVGDC